MAENMPAAPPPAQKVRVRSWFVYPVPATVLQVGGQGSASVQIDAATNFYWVKTTYFADDNAAQGDQTDATLIVPSVDAQVTVTGADKNLFNARLPVPSFAGDGRLPYVMPFPMVLSANSEIRFDYLSREGTRVIRLVLALHGWKDYGEMYEGE